MGDLTLLPVFRRSTSSWASKRNTDSVEALLPWRCRSIAFPDFDRSGVKYRRGCGQAKFWRLRSFPRLLTMPLCFWKARCFPRAASAGRLRAKIVLSSAASPKIMLTSAKWRFHNRSSQGTQLWLRALQSARSCWAGRTRICGVLTCHSLVKGGNFAFGNARIGIRENGVWRQWVDCTRRACATGGRRVRTPCTSGCGFITLRRGARERAGYRDCEPREFAARSAFLPSGCCRGRS